MTIVQRVLTSGLLLFALRALAVAQVNPVELVPGDAIAVIAWDALVEPNDPRLAVPRQALEILRVIENGSTDSGDFLEWSSRLSELGALCGSAPGAVAILDFGARDGKPEVSVVAAFATGGKTTQVRKLFDEMLAEAGGAGGPQSVDVKGAALQQIRAEETDLLWGEYKGHFVAAIGRSGAERLISRLSAGGPGLSANAEFQFGAKKAGHVAKEPGATVFIDLAALQERFVRMAGPPGGELSPEARKALDELAIDSFRSLYLRSAPRTVPPETRCFVHVTPSEKGLPGFWKQAALRDEDLMIVPPDAFWAYVTNLDLLRFWQELRRVVGAVSADAGEQVDAGLVTARQFVGFSITDDLLPALGDTWALVDGRQYLGLPLVGCALILDVKDSAALHGMLLRSIEVATPLVAQSNVKLVVRSSQHGPHEIHYLLLGGKPVPLAPAWGFADGRCVLGLAPQVVAAALQQVDPKTRKSSIVDQPEFKSLRDKLPKDAVSVSYTDTRAFTRWGYGLGLAFTHVAASLGAGRSETLDPLKIVPPLPDLLASVTGTVGTCTVEADGVLYAQVGSGDIVTGTVVGGALGASILLPSLARARELAKRAVCASNLRQIAMALHIHANDHAGNFPTNLQALIDDGMLAPGAFVCPASGMEAKNVAAMLANPGGPQPIVYVAGQKESDDVRNVVAYENPWNHDGEGLNVAFLDGHVQFMKLEEFKQALLETYQRLNREDEVPPDLRPAPAQKKPTETPK